ncbi:nucleotidyl transferase AbiEii/AbiGii toxin family protein [Schaalia sp. ZJ405]|uniref:nucleotidyl transferase AbiEii/AbiGii toxin family protein n=1 Tax=Schaalia sp. ZJ405 TaxID=2709403 RepID=UPI0013EA1A87|nr:nucleotidyl transferase AbiEii/AbiGii toxin family protein [Schaalia sp. ZJ405]QPK81008.1 nucleotidyl transferase AbiEii/AbiGii toxin family protein [Schaalia sp. ZJ405]
MTITSAAQLKGRIKDIARERGIDPRVLLRIYMMERFLDRVSRSTYQDRFILKGGMLISYLVGVNLRTTMDIDTTMYDLPLNLSGVQEFIDETLSIDTGDSVSFVLVRLEEIMEEADYPGIRAHLNAIFDGTTTPVKIDISTGHTITPAAVTTSLEAMFAEPIPMLVYPTATIIAEKLQTVLSRATFNTRMRDFYDLYALTHTFGTHLDPTELQAAFLATMETRNSMPLVRQVPGIMNSISASTSMRELWNQYSRRYNWAQDITWEDVLASTQELLHTALPDF